VTPRKKKTAKMKERDSFGRRFKRRLSHKIPGLRRSHVFDAELNLNDLTAVPFVKGEFFCAIHVNEGARFRGKTECSQVKRHTINWDQAYNFTCRLYSKKSDAVLDPCPCRISIIQEATGGAPQRHLGHVIVDLAENAGSGDSHQGLLIQQERKNHRVGNSIFNLKSSLKLRYGDVIFRTSNADDQAAQANYNRRSSLRESQDADTFHNLKRIEMRPDMKPLGLVHACDRDEARAENAGDTLHIRRNSLTSVSTKNGTPGAASERGKAMRRFNRQMELLKHQQYIEELLMNDTPEKEDEDDLDRMQVHKRASWKDIYSKRVQRQYRFSDKKKMIVRSRVSNFDAVKEVFQNVGILTDFTDLTKRSRSKSKTLTGQTGTMASTDTQKSRLAKAAQLAKGNFGKDTEEKTVSQEGTSRGNLGEDANQETVSRRSQVSRATMASKKDLSKEKLTKSKSQEAKEETASRKSRVLHAPRANQKESSKEKLTKSKSLETGEAKANSDDAALLCLGNLKPFTVTPTPSGQSLTSIWATDSAPRAKKSKSSMSSKKSSGSSTDPTKKGQRIQDIEYENLMLHQEELQDRKEQRKRNFIQRLKAMMAKSENDKKSKKRGLIRRKKEREESISGCKSLDIFEESESEFSWTKRKLPILQSRPHIMADIVGYAQHGASEDGSLMDNESVSTERTQSLLSQSILNVGNRVDLRASRDYFSSLKQREEPGQQGHRPNERIFSSIESDEVNMYPFRDFQFRIAEEEAIKSNEDVSIRGRRQARKNKLVLSMIKETEAYLLRETDDNNLQKAKLRIQEAKKAAAERESASAEKSNSSDRGGGTAEKRSRDKPEMTTTNLPLKVNV